jgi:mono/diheme cytochrome c family protein
LAKKITGMKRVVKIVKWFGIILLVIISGLVAVIYARHDRTFEAPLPDIKASTDSAVLARGKYLVYGPAHCNYCHATRDEVERMKKGEELPLAGGLEFDMPIGKIVTPNLTPDPETGLTKLSDGEIARALRYGVNHRGHAMFEFMPFQNASDEDLTAIVSFIRSMPPVKRKLPEPTFNLLGKGLHAFVLKPVGPTGTPPKSVKQDTTAEYGKYLVNSIGNCRGCHTPRDMLTGAYTGPDFSGGVVFEGEPGMKGKFITPNLTPDKGTGLIAEWSEKTFVDRFRRGRYYEGSPMPWESFSRMTDNDLKAIYRYLQTVKPISNNPGAPFTPEQPTK